jgi:hypothetical protein
MDFVLSKRGQELVRGMSRIADRIDTRPGQVHSIEGIQLAFLPAEVLDNFERYAKLFEETSGRR